MMDYKDFKDENYQWLRKEFLGLFEYITIDGNEEEFEVFCQENYDEYQREEQGEL